MKTTEQINQIKNMKSLIAEMVAEHKSTKSVARMSSKDEKYSSWKTASAQGKSVAECESLLVVYTAYYVLRHYFEDKAAVDQYIASVYLHLRAEKQNKRYPMSYFGVEPTAMQGWHSTCGFHQAVKCCIECIEKYTEQHQEKEEVAA